MDDQEIIIHTDGGSRGNPGPAACAFVVENNNQVIFRGSRFLKTATNNIAEYSGVILALEWLNKKSDEVKLKSEIKFFLDSELVVKQLNGLYKVKDENIKKLFLEVKNLILKLEKNVFFQHIPREKNKDADRLVNEELDRNIS